MVLVYTMKANEGNEGLSNNWECKFSICSIYRYVDVFVFVLEKFSNDSVRIATPTKTTSKRVNDTDFPKICSNKIPYKYTIYLYMDKR